MNNISIVCKDFDVTDAIKSYIHDKMSSLNKFFQDETISINVKIKLGKTTNKQSHGKIFYIDIGIKTSRKNFGCYEEAEDIYMAIDRVKDELSRSIVQFKDKSITSSRKEDKKIKEDLRNIN